MNQTNIGPEEMIKILNGKDHKQTSDFIQTANRLGCIPEIRYVKAHCMWKCVFSKQKRKRVLFTLECNENKWDIKANLFHMDQYRQIVESCSDEIKNRIKAGYDCKMCSPRCKGGTEFTLDGHKYKKCIGCCFYFNDMINDDWNSLKILIENESAY